MIIKDLRKQLNLSQSKFAKKFNIPVGTIHNWEQGISTPPPYIIFMIKLIIDFEYYKTPVVPLNISKSDIQNRGYYGCCPNCGNALESLWVDKKFCSECGRAIDWNN